MARFKLTLEYEGTRYYGWQFQPKQATVQGKFFDACKTVFNTNHFELYGAGRTDSGVHALQQVAHLDVKTNIPADKIRIKMNDQLPYDINILKVENANPKFHARYDAVSRSYVYQIATRKTAFGKTNVWWIKDKLDLDMMKKVAEIYTGFKDYRSFSDDDPEEKSTTVEINFVNIHHIGDSIYIHINGSHFLWKMVRRMVGVMAEVARGNGLSLNKVESFFTKFNNQPAKYTAPPSGLYLERIYYQNDIVDTNILQNFVLNSVK